MHKPKPSSAELFFANWQSPTPAFVKGCKSIFSQQCKGARASGISEEKMAAIPLWTSSDLFDGKERAVLAYVDELALAGGLVQDATFNRLREHFVDEAILELTYIYSLYQAYATFTHALKLEYNDIDEWVAEVPAPEGSGDEVDVIAAMNGGSDR